MDLSPIILAMAEAEGPSSVLSQVVAPLLEHDEILLTRVWFLDDCDCPVCDRRRDPTSGMISPTVALQRLSARDKKRARSFSALL